MAQILVTNFQSSFAGVFMDAMTFSNEKGEAQFMWRLGYTGGSVSYFVEQQDFERYNQLKSGTLCRVFCDLTCDGKQNYKQKVLEYQFEGISKDFAPINQIELDRGSIFKGYAIFADKTDWLTPEGSLLYYLHFKTIGSRHKLPVSREIYESINKTQIGGYFQCEGIVDSRIVSFEGPKGRSYKNELKLILEKLQQVELNQKSKSAA